MNMAFRLLFLLFLALSVDVQWASARTAARHLGVYRSPVSSSSSPDTSTPSDSGSASSPSSGGSSPYPTSPSDSSPSGSSPDSSSPVVDTPPTDDSYTPPSSDSSPSAPDTPSSPSGGGSSPSSSGYSPPSDSSPVMGSPLSSPGVESPLSSPEVMGSPLSSPLVGSPLSTPTPDISTPTGGKGSCGFWSKHGVKFPSILSRIASLGSIFGGHTHSIFGGKMTLMEALRNPNMDEYSALARQGTASLLNAYAYGDSFAFTPEQVRQNFNAGLQNPLAARQQASLFEQANNALP